MESDKDMLYCIWCWYPTVILMFQRQRQEDQDMEATLSYEVSLRPACTSLDPILKNNKTK